MWPRTRMVTLLAMPSMLGVVFWAQSDSTPQVRMGLQKPPKISFAAPQLPDGVMQAKATTACTECHEARIILQQRLGKAAWTKEVDKMVKWGALVDANDHDALVDYLSTNFSPDKAPYEPPKDRKSTRLN